MRKMKLFFASLAVLMSSVAFAQNMTVKGVITDVANGEPVAGANVLLKGDLMTHTTSDLDGQYSISVPANGTLVVSFLGYHTQEISVDGRAKVDVVLSPDAETLEDVIVVAYGTVRREANTGAVSSVKSDEIAAPPVTSVDKMLSGKMAGVQMSSYSGQPGSTSSIRIRGTSSINAGNEPLWVVDGLPIIAEDNRASSNMGTVGGSTTAFLNPNDIESITVLKDAAAASIYGSRAANGVILVTTKSGKAGKAKFQVRAKYGAQQLANDNNFRPMTGEELVNYWRDAAVNGGYNPDDPSSPYYVPMSLLENGTHNWYKDLTKIGTVQEYEVNATGGNRKGSYYSSLSYHKNDGVYYGTDYSRFSARVNADYRLLESLKTGTRVNVSYNNSNSGPMGSSFYANPAFAMFKLLPWTPMYNEDGTFSQPSENGGLNPYSQAYYNEDNDKEYRFNGSMYLEWQPIKQLTLKSNNGAEASFINSRSYSNPLADPDGSKGLSEYSIQEMRYTTSNTITYNDTFTDHEVRVLLGQEAMLDQYEYVGGYSTDIDDDIPYLSTGTQAKDQVGYGFSEYSMLSFFGVADYNYANRYYFQASARYDGSSLFGSERRWGLFWSVSGSWNITKENWMAPVRGWMSNLKLRASYGVNGNNNISPYRAYGVYSSLEYNGATGMFPSRPANPELSWEKNKTANVGLDFGFFDDRLTGSVDLYHRLTDDMLLSKQVPYTTGFGSNFMNTGSLQNKGLEITLDGILVRRNDFYWSAGVNVSFNRTKVLDLAGSEFLVVSDSRAGSSYAQETPVRIVEGMSLYNFYIRDYAGVNPSTGEGLFWTEEGTLTSDRSKGRYIYAGSPEAKFTGGFNTSFSWKGLSLSAFFDFTYGNKVMVGNWFITDGEDTLASNSQASSLNYWKNPGDTGVTPKPIAGGSNVWYAGYSTRFLQDGSYLRIKDVTLSYTLPEKLTKAIKMQGIKVYVSALNPYTFHNVDALDPDMGPVGYAYGGNHTAVKSVVGGIEVTF